ncbi:MAG: TonB-dependent receptor plug domain-containing protein [Pirellulales bacterium]
MSFGQLQRRAWQWLLAWIALLSGSAWAADPSAIQVADTVSTVAAAQVEPTPEDATAEPAANKPAAAGDSPAARTGTTDGLNPDMKLDELVKQDVLVPALTQVVTTVDRQESTVGHSPAAVFVITQDMIKRSGARCIPEALRMAPGIQVAKISSSTWAITARGFQGRFANKLLVQIDRRVVYTPTFGGVFWDIQDVVLADVERIEVIRGPGTTAWGSNAVNGVINIITKSSKDTQGALVQSGGGNYEQDFNTVRYGGKVNECLSWRAWGQQFDRGPGWSGDEFVPDGWRQQRFGFRTDWTPTKEDTVTVQGDLYNGYDGQRFDNTVPFPPFSVEVTDKVHVSGGDLLMRWSRDLDEDTGWQLQSYFMTDRRHQTAWQENRNMWDIDFQHRFSPAEYHQVIWGANYRWNQDRERGGFSFMLIPNDFLTQWANVFAQDEMTLVEDYLYFTAGCRLEYNTFGRFQPEPTLRLLWLPSKEQCAWMAVSRAVRNPTRFDTGIRLRTSGPTPGTFFQFDGDPSFQPETVLAYEAGYRAQPTQNFSWDICGYINDYRKLRGLGPLQGITIIPPGLPTFVIPLANNVSAVSYGAELTATWQVRENWQLFGAYTLFEVNAKGAPGTDQFFVEQYNYATPHNALYMRSSWDLTDKWQFDLIPRYMDRVTFNDVPKYIEMDARLAWHPNANLEVSLIGQNLLNPHHLEYTDFELGLFDTEVRRGVYGMITWTH